MPTTTITYSPNELKSGKCESCGDKSKEIIIEEGICFDCHTSNLFYEETMKGLDGEEEEEDPY